MKKILSFSGAILLFWVTCVGLNLYDNHIISEKKTALPYYNTDDRNSCKIAMEEVLSKCAIPVFGSSELSAADDVAYPPTLFRNGNSDFNMVLIGRGSMQSLHHAINLGAMSDIIPDKKVVLILSPQWFTTTHLGSEAYASRFSERMFVEFIKNDDISYETKTKVTGRVKNLLTVDEQQLERIEKYEKVYLNHSLNPISHAELSVYNSFMNMKQLFLLKNKVKTLQNDSEKTVQTKYIDYSALLVKAEEAGKIACTNNDLYIYDEYYNTYVKDSRDANKNSASTSSYLESPEYGDLRLFLDVCKETGIRPLIVSIPVNGRWYDWTGFPLEGRNAYYQNIRDICKEYDVDIADFSDKEYEPYFLKDTMHLGWKGWVYLDEAVYQFYTETIQ